MLIKWAWHLITSKYSTCKNSEYSRAKQVPHLFNQFIASKLSATLRVDFTIHTYKYESHFWQPLTVNCQQWLRIILHSCLFFDFLLHCILYTEWVAMIIVKTMPTPPLILQLFHQGLHPFFYSLAVFCMDTHYMHTTNFHTSCYM